MLLRQPSQHRLQRSVAVSSHLPRRGITLLFVVSMIVLFLLMGTAFVVVSNNFHSASKSRLDRERYRINHSAYLESAFYNLLRGPSLSDATSPLRGHSLLGDMYGYGFSAIVDSASADSSGHFITLTIDNNAQKIIDGSRYTPQPVPGALSGLVLSVVTGNAGGLSGRIVDHRISGTGTGAKHVLVVMPHWLDNNFAIADANVMIGARVIVNGRPFAGTGAGHFDRGALTSPSLSATALQPNQLGRSRNELLGGTGNGYFSADFGGVIGPNSLGPNEPYDAFDFQNMFLAGIRADGSVIEPSFHRQDLIDNGPNPMRADFRAFTAGGPGNDGVVVDNNNDGVPEGIWIDAGFPTRTSPDGTCYKPLVSYTVLDMDSRINVNAHGNLLQINPQMSEVAPLLDGTDPSQLSRGQGYGPPEVDVNEVLGLASAPILFGRYGPDGQPGEAGVRDRWSGYKLFGLPNGSFSDPIPSTVGHHYGSTMDLFGRFAVGYFDIKDISDGRTPISMPMANVGFSNLTNEVVDSPYEMNFSEDAFFGPVNRGSDTPYTPRELEAVLRSADIDSRLLPQRLLNDGSGMLNSIAKNLVTTSSFEVPSIHENLVGRLYRILSQPNSGSQPEGIPDSTPNREQAIRDQLQLLAAPEFRRGLPLNVNRPLGDGIDNNGDGVIDEIGESDSLIHPSGTPLGFDHDNDSQTSGDFDTIFARFHFARQLFVATLLVTEQVDRNGDGTIDQADWYDFDEDGDVDQADRIAYRRVIAQWAVNVVDFRDPDSIMTPFEVDLNPFNGWDVDQDITTTESITENGTEMRHVFWGAERPELLLTETFATHDLRTQDLQFETTQGGETAGTTSTGDDTDFDNHLVPNVSFFCELYNPWVINDANQVRAAELYESSRNGVDLQKVSRDGSSPVWRLVVTEVDDPATGEDERYLDPDDPENNGGTQQQFTRRIYFTQPSIDGGPEVYFPEASVVSEPVEPGLYAVVGSAGIKTGNRYDSYLGRRNTPTSLDATELQDQTRRITLDPVNGRLEIVKFNRIAGDVMTAETRDIVTLPIGVNDGRERNLGVSDPINGYGFLTDPENGFNIELEAIADGHKFIESFTTGSPLDYAFDTPIDQLLDSDHYDRYLRDDGLIPSYRVVHLQRLANPNRRFDPQTNPYLTIDSSSIDLLVFNGAYPQPDPTRGQGTMAVTTYERRCEQNGDSTEVNAGRHRLLFRNDQLGRVNASDSTPFTQDQHILNYNLEESLGLLNASYRDSIGDDGSGNPIQRPFAWLAWNNRPFVSQLELANVPFTTSYQLTRTFNVADENRDVYEPDDSPVPETGAIHLSGHFPHLLNFYTDKIESNDAGPSLHRLFDVTEVPSRFVGTESFVNPTTFANNAHGLSQGLAAPFDRISNYRYPGKINLNTITDARVWNAVMGRRYQDRDVGVSFDEWQQSMRGGSAVTQFGNPLRPAYAANQVPLADLVVDPADSGLFRKITGSDTPLFDYSPPSDMQLAATDSHRAAYFRYDMRQRLGNLATNRSSVFGVWITVGYFETYPDGSLKTNAGQGIEVGSASGEVQRGRGFFMVDRSIPVAFEPGNNHNVDRAVLVKSLLD